MAAGITKYIVELAHRVTGQKEFVQGFQHIDKAVARHKKELMGFRATHTETFQKTMPDGSKQLTGFAATLRNNDGQVKQLAASYDKFGNITTSNVRDVTDAQGHLNKQLKVGRGFSTQFIDAMKRAIIVAPVWMLMRSIMMGLIRTISDGVRIMEQYDRAMQKSKQVMHGVQGATEQFAETLDKQIRKTAMETGTAIEQLSDYFYRFGTVGLEADKAMQGMVATNKIAIAMFAEQREGVEIARMLAETYRLLGDTVDDSIPPHLKMEAIGAKLHHLWRENAFEIGEMAGAMKQFLPTAASFNFTVDESVALMASLHTASMKSTRAGRLLRTSIAQLMGRVDEAATKLGIFVDEGDRTFDVFMKVISAIRELEEAGDAIPDMDLFELFGGVRSREAALALIALGEQLDKNLEVSQIRGQELLTLIDSFNDSYEEQLEQTYKQMERFRTLRGLVGEAFVTGITGAEDFQHALMVINDYLERDLIPNMRNFGEFIHEWRYILMGLIGIWGALKFKVLAVGGAALYTAKQMQNFFEQITVGEDDVRKHHEEMMDNMASITDLFKAQVKFLERQKIEEEIGKQTDEWKKAHDAYQNYVRDLRDEGKLVHTRHDVGVEGGRELVEAMDDAGLSAEQTLSILHRLRDAGYGIGDAARFIRDYQEGIADAFDKQTGQVRVLKQETIDKISMAREELQLTKLQAAGLSDSEIASKRLAAHVEQRVNAFNRAVKEAGRVEKSLDKQRIISLALAGEHEKILQLFEGQYVTQEQLVEWEQLRGEIIRARLQEQERAQGLLVSHAEQMLRAQGANNLQLIEARTQLEDALGIRRDIITELDRELEKQRAIAEQEDKRRRASGEIVTLWQIQRRHGEAVAKNIHQVLQGEKEFRDLSRRERIIAAQHFRGPIEQMAAARWEAETDWIQPQVDATKTLNQTMIELPNKLVQAFRELERLGAEIEPRFEVNNEIYLDGQALGREFIKKIVSEMKREGSEVSKAVDDRIERY